METTANGSIVSALLSLAHTLFQPGFCPGDWVWATSMAGALIALVPVVGMVIVALMRKFTGNRYHGVPLFVIAGVGVVFVLAIPWFLMNGVSGVYRDVFAGGTGGLSASEVATLHNAYCFVGEQSTYLGGGQNVYETLFYPSDSVLAYGYYLGALVGLPILALLAVMLLGRVALRRGPKWPGRLLWGSFVAFVLFASVVEANTAVHLWLGFLPAAVLGVIPVALVGPPSWSTIQNSDRPPERPQPPPYVPPEQKQQPPPPPEKQYPPTSVAPAQDAGALAAVPGPVPVPPGSGAAGSSRFRRIRRLGHGGFGTVWEAQDMQLGRTVALKIAHAPDEDTEQRMQREARALAMVNHPNCVRVYDLVEEPDGLALVMEYLEGQALAEAVDGNGPLDDLSAGRLWATLAGALSEAHDKGVLHRDMKPSNVIVDGEGIPHLIDFGIARSKGDSKLTATGMMIGTPDYVAPETAAGAPASPASDAWQLAATVSFALSGYPPRGTRETPMAALMAAARAEPPSQLPRQSVHARLLIASLDPQPRNRPTLKAVQREVEGWLSRTGHSAEGPVTRVVPRIQ
ncbi:serine/threonine protein kinase [Prauserella marina]|uniref:non-specific serine/threonine protein kinase n=1 Tax=Prauserella marina TaxID=530584 RepID=A0A222VWH4_9PSEU|nr:serine/threonine-protein kinase [Prauserella marina]ASR38071.1 serine/threonine protein kinase [Prauserella marina]PWV73315.1 serine/threonine protein kinase [Prauserella marina]SDD66576.1 Serine/threonine protein kinase [Prauserella marina]